MATISTLKAAVLKFEHIQVGQLFETGRSFSTDDVQRFAAVSGDWSPLHVDPDYAAGTEFGSCVVHGMLLASFFSQLVGRIPGTSALYLGQDLAFRWPVLVGELVRASAKVTAKNEATMPLVLATEIRNATGSFLGLSKALAVESAGDGIRVKMVSPGLARTLLTEHYNERIFEIEAARTPLGRTTTLDDIATTVVFLSATNPLF